MYLVALSCTCHSETGQFHVTDVFSQRKMQKKKIRKGGSGIHIWKQPQGVTHDRVCFKFFYEPESEFFLEY